MTGDTAAFATVLVAHGDRGGASPNAALRAQAKAVSARVTPAHVCAGVLKGEPSLESALAEAGATGAQRIVVYPLFMADGYFMRKVRERVAAAGLSHAPAILDPLGLDPALPEILLQETEKMASREGIEPVSARLLVVGHGSKLGPAAANATRKAAARAAIARRFATVTTAFLEEEPFLDDMLRRGGAQPTVVAGFFFGDGMHAGEDVPDAIEETGANAIYTGAIGNSPAVANLIASAITAAARAPRP